MVCNRGHAAGPTPLPHGLSPDSREPADTRASLLRACLVTEDHFASYLAAGRARELALLEAALMENIQGLM